MGVGALPTHSLDPHPRPLPPLDPTTRPHHPTPWLPPPLPHYLDAYHLPSLYPLDPTTPTTPLTPLPPWSPLPHQLTPCTPPTWSHHPTPWPNHPYHLTPTIPYPLTPPPPTPLTHLPLWPPPPWQEFCVQFWSLFHGQDHLVLSNSIRKTKYTSRQGIKSRLHLHLPQQIWGISLACSTLTCHKSSFCSTCVCQVLHNPH